MSTTFILIVEVIQQLIKIKYKDLPLCDLIIFPLKTPSQGQAPRRAAKNKLLTDSDISGLVLKTPRSWLGHTRDWLDTVL